MTMWYYFQCNFPTPSCFSGGPADHGRGRPWHDGRWDVAHERDSRTRDVIPLPQLLPVSIAQEARSNNAAGEEETFM